MLTSFNKLSVLFCIILYRRTKYCAFFYVIDTAIIQLSRRNICALQFGNANLHSKHSQVLIILYSIIFVCYVHFIHVFVCCKYVCKLHLNL